jgi:hypothetical protein
VRLRYLITNNITINGLKRAAARQQFTLKTVELRVSIDRLHEEKRQAEKIFKTAIYASNVVL